MADIIFNIVGGKLSGTADGYSFDVHASSGGRGGSKTKNAAHPVIVNNPFLTTMKLPGHKDRDYAGALPMGIYKLELHEHKENWIRLIPATLNVMHGRDGFAIHGRGLRGSDGCIVPNDFSIVQKLCKLVKDRSDKGLSPLTLEVKAVGDLDYFLRMMDDGKRMG